MDELTVLLVAEGERLAPAWRARLIERGVAVELAPYASAAATAFAVAPDLVVLAGRAADEGGAEVLAGLAEQSVTATLPVVLVTEPGVVRPRLSAFRHGLVAVIERSASADDMARRIAELARELPERPGQSEGRLEETGVDELVELFAESLRSGILSVSREGGESAQVILRADRPVAETIAELVERIRPLVGAGGEQAPLHYEFHESVPSRLSSIDVGDDVDADGSFDGLAGRRILLVEQSASRSDVLAQHLRAAGATVAVVDGAGRGVELARDLTPELVLIDGSGMESWAVGALRAIRGDPWLRWASVLVVDAGRLWANPRHPDLPMIAPKIAALVGPDEDLARRARQRSAIAARLDVIGPIRMLRALASTGLGLRMRVSHPRTSVVVDLAEGLVAGATAQLPGRSEPIAEGPAALGALIGLGSGRVQITRVDTPRTANVMAPIDDALAAAAAEDPVIAPSLPPPSVRPAERTSEPGMARGELPGLVRRLEALLGALGEEDDGAGAEEQAEPPPEPARTETSEAKGGTARPSELPRFEEPEAEEHATGHYDPEMVERLRARMRRSSPRFEAVKEQPERVGEEPPPPPARRALPPPAARIPPPPARGALSSLSSRSSAPAGSSRRRVARRAATLVLGSVAEDAGAAATDEEVAAAPTVPPSSGVRDRVTPAPVEPPEMAMADGAAGARTEAPSRAGDAPKGDASVRPERAAPEVSTPAAQEVSTPAAREVSKPTAPEGSKPAAPEVSTPAAREVSKRAAPEVSKRAAPGSPASDLPARQGPTDGRSAPHHPAQPPLPPPTGPDPAHTERSEPAAAATPGPTADLFAPAQETDRHETGGPSLGPTSASTSGRWRIAAFAALAVIPVALVGAIALWLLPGDAVPATAGLGEPPTPASPAVEAPPSQPESGGASLVDEPTDPADQAADQAAAPEAAPPAETRPIRASGAVIGPGPDDPIEGLAEDFELARFGIEPAAPPDSRRARVRLVREEIREANRLRNHGQLDEAAAHYRGLLAAFPDNARATAGMARVHMEREEAAEAILYAQRLARLRPRYASNFVLLGDALRLGDNRAAARRAYQRAVELEPGWAPARRRIEELDGAD